MQQISEYEIIIVYMHVCVCISQLMDCEYRKPFLRFFFYVEFIKLVRKTDAELKKYFKAQIWMVHVKSLLNTVYTLLPVH